MGDERRCYGEEGFVCPETARQKRAKTLSPCQAFFSAGVELLNLIVAVGLEELSQVNDPEEWEAYAPVRPEEDT